MCSTPTYLFELKQKIQNWRTKPRCERIKNGYQPHLIELPSEYLPDLTVFDCQQFMLTEGTLAPGKLRKEKKTKITVTSRRLNLLPASTCRLQYRLKGEELPT